MQLTPLSTLWAPRKKNKKKGTIFFGHGVQILVGDVEETKPLGNTTRGSEGTDLRLAIA